MCWVFVSVQGLSPFAASGGHSSSRCTGLSLSRPLLLRSTGSRRAGSVIVAHGPSCSAACGILPDQGSNQCPLHWQADSQPLRHQGSPQQCHFGELLDFLNWQWAVEVHFISRVMVEYLLDSWATFLTQSVRALNMIKSFLGYGFSWCVWWPFLCSSALTVWFYWM